MPINKIEKNFSQKQPAQSSGFSSYCKAAVSINKLNKNHSQIKLTGRTSRSQESLGLEAELIDSKIQNRKPSNLSARLTNEQKQILKNVRSQSSFDGDSQPQSVSIRESETNQVDVAGNTNQSASSYYDSEEDEENIAASQASVHQKKPLSSLRNHKNEKSPSQCDDNKTQSKKNVQNLHLVSKSSDSQQKYPKISLQKINTLSTPSIRDNCSDDEYGIRKNFSSATKTIERAKISKEFTENKEELSQAKRDGRSRFNSINLFGVKGKKKAKLSSRDTKGNSTDNFLSANDSNEFKKNIDPSTNLSCSPFESISKWSSGKFNLRETKEGASQVTKQPSSGLTNSSGTREHIQLHDQTVVQSNSKVGSHLLNLQSDSSSEKVNLPKDSAPTNQPSQRSLQTESLTESKSKSDDFDPDPETSSLQTEIEQIIEEKDEEDEESRSSQSLQSEPSEDSDESRSKFAARIRSQILQRSTTLVPEEYQHFFGDEGDEKEQFKASKPKKRGKAVIKRTITTITKKPKKAKKRVTRSNERVKEHAQVASGDNRIDGLDRIDNELDFEKQNSVEDTGKSIKRSKSVCIETKRPSSMGKQAKQKNPKQDILQEEKRTINSDIFKHLQESVNTRVRRATASFKNDHNGDEDEGLSSQSFKQLKQNTKSSVETQDEKKDTPDFKFKKKKYGTSRGLYQLKQMHTLDSKNSLLNGSTSDAFTFQAPVQKSGDERAENLASCESRSFGSSSSGRRDTENFVKKVSSKILIEKPKFVCDSAGSSSKNDHEESITNIAAKIIVKGNNNLVVPDFKEKMNNSESVSLKNSFEMEKSDDLNKVASDIGTNSPNGRKRSLPYLKRKPMPDYLKNIPKKLNYQAKSTVPSAKSIQYQKQLLLGNHKRKQVQLSAGKIDPQSSVNRSANNIVEAGTSLFKPAMAGRNKMPQAPGTCPGSVARSHELLQVPRTVQNQPTADHLDSQGQNQCGPEVRTQQIKSLADRIKRNNEQIKQMVKVAEVNQSPATQSKEQFQNVMNSISSKKQALLQTTNRKLSRQYDSDMRTKKSPSFGDYAASSFLQVELNKSPSLLSNAPITSPSHILKSSGRQNQNNLDRNAGLETFLRLQRSIETFENNSQNEKSGKTRASVNRSNKSEIEH